MFKKILITILFALALLGACDYEVAGKTVYRGWIGRIADALHEAHGGEPHSGRDEKPRKLTPAEKMDSIDRKKPIGKG